MKQFLFLFILSFFTVSGCTFLRGGETVSEDDVSAEESYYGESAGFDEESMEPEEGLFVEDSVDATEEIEETEEVEEEEEEELKKPKKSKGFFSWIFGSSDEEEENEESATEEDSAFSEDDGYTVETRDEVYMDSTEEPESITTETISTPTEEPESASTETISTPTEESVDFTTAKVETSSVEKSPTKNIPLNKIISSPYQKSGQLVNAVYIARQGDTLEGISQKIYGSDRKNILLQINPHLSSRPIKVGDKVYYNSPSRPDDSTQLLFYYQEINASSSVYTLSPGDNIRTVAFQLLGHSNSWKEIWATNPDLMSKGAITRNINITYWPKNASATPSTPPIPPSTPPPQQAPIEAKAPSEPDSSLEAQKHEEVGKKDSEPVAEESFPPPPPPPVSNVAMNRPQKSQKSIYEIILEQKELVGVFIGIVIILILMIRLILRKRRQRDFDYTATNIEI